MQRRPGRQISLLSMASFVSVSLLAAAAEPTKKPTPTKVSLGGTVTYQTLGKLAVMHEGRIKPLDTVAREEIKGIYTRETIRLTSPDGSTITSWSPVAAFFDWSVRPKFWDDQAIIAVEFLPLKRFILADEIKLGLEAVAAKAATSEADRKRIKDLVASTEISSNDLRSLVRGGKFDEADAVAIEKLAAKVGEETRYLSPSELETADVTVDGKKVPFLSWLDGVTKKKQGRPMMGASGPLTELENKGFEIGIRLAHYRAIRDKEPMGEVPLLMTPRPANQAMLMFSARSLNKGVETRGVGMSQLEMEAAGSLYNYNRDIDIKDQAEPGTDSHFDTNYTRWLKEKSPWVPLGVIREASIEELTLAGFPTEKVEAFRVAYKAMEDEELTNPGRAAEKPALALLQAAVDLGDTTNDSYYPSVVEMARESHYNALAPFFWSTIAYGIGALALTFSLISTSFGRSMKLDSSFGVISKALYFGGISSLSAGIGLEVYGFILRILITGWAPVTNMEETVIYVGVVAAILGLVMEAIYKWTYTALAAAGVGLICTALSANVEMLDPHIKMLPPVLRSNFWLSIHVMTIVSSYAAFALAMGLGQIALTLYLTATYKRSASYFELAKPLIAGVPLFVLGFLGYHASYGKFGAGEIIQANGFWPSIVIGCIGGVVSLTSVVAVSGELINRAIFRKKSAETSGPASDDLFASPLAPPIEPQPVKAGPTDEARVLAMQATAAQIKPISNFIYRAMQVGILLVTAGTFLGGWWADVSWGRFWGWDPKEVWALITLLVYLVPLHGRFAGWVNTFWLVMASAVCFLSVLMAWYGVNFVLGVGLHSYGFGDKEGQGVVGVVTLIGLSYALGTAWRRYVSQYATKSVV